MKIIILILLIIGAVIITLQDFRHRLISLWVLILYALTCVGSAYMLHGWLFLCSNFVTTVLYFLFTGGILILYYFFREKKFSNPLNSKIGAADLILFLAIGFTMEITVMILFFCISFIISAFLALLVFNKRNESTPLAGILSILYVFCYCVINLTGYFVL